MPIDVGRSITYVTFKARTATAVVEVGSSYVAVRCLDFS